MFGPVWVPNNPWLIVEHATTGSSVPIGLWEPVSPACVLRFICVSLRVSENTYAYAGFRKM